MINTLDNFKYKYSDFIKDNSPQKYKDLDKCKNLYIKNTPLKLTDI